MCPGPNDDYDPRGAPVIRGRGRRGPHRKQRAGRVVTKGQAASAADMISLNTGLPSLIVLQAGLGLG